jgi:hypothetical protein
MRNVSTNDDTGLLSKQWVVGLLNITGGTSKFGIDLHGNIRAILRLSGKNVLVVQTCCANISRDERYALWVTYIATLHQCSSHKKP